jgi:hypothetical protein
MLSGIISELRSLRSVLKTVELSSVSLDVRLVDDLFLGY